MDVINIVDGSIGVAVAGVRLVAIRPEPTDAAR